MVQIIQLPPAPGVALADLLPVWQGGTNGVTRKGNVSQLGAALGLGAAPSGHFFADQGALVARVNDRLLLGAAADNPAMSNWAATPTDWLSTLLAGTNIGAWPVAQAQGAAIARNGTIGWVGASRTSDAASATPALGYQPTASIGGAFFAVDDDTTNPRTTNAYALYAHGIRMAGAAYRPFPVVEIEGVNLGPVAVGDSNPYQVNLGGGVVALQIGSGGSHNNASDIETGIAFVNNPTRMRRGIIFQSTSLTGTDGTASDTGFATAIALSRNQGLSWRTPETVSGAHGVNVGLIIRSTVAAGANATHWEAQDSGVVISNGAGQQLIAINTRPNAVNSLYFQAGDTGVAAGLYAAAGTTGGNGNLGLFPATGAELQITSPLTGGGGAMPATAGAGFLHITINGTSYRVAAFTSAQVGG